MLRFSRAKVVSAVVQAEWKPMHSGSSEKVTICSFIAQAVTAAAAAAALSSSSSSNHATDVVSLTFLVQCGLSRTLPQKFVLIRVEFNQDPLNHPIRRGLPITQVLKIQFGCKFQSQTDGELFEVPRSNDGVDSSRVIGLSSSEYASLRFVPTTDSCSHR